MLRSRSAAAFAAACLPVLCAGQAHAHVVAGARVFPVTLTFDDPGTNDEASLPSFNFTRSAASGGPGPIHNFDFGFEYDKRITENTALILNDGYNVQRVENSKTQTGFTNLFITGKWQFYLNPEHEFVASVGIIREFGGTGTIHTGADHYGGTAPAGYFGKGLGDLPIGLLRPLAVTGELTYTIADKELKATYPQPQASPGVFSTAPLTTGVAAEFNGGNSNAWFGGISLQYSFPYLQSQVRNVGLRGIFADLIPIVEFTWSSPASSPSAVGTTWTAAPGVIYLADWGELGVEALIPLNKAAGTNVGVVGLVHFFFDDLFPNTIGKPIFN